MGVYLDTVDKIGTIFSSGSNLNLTGLVVAKGTYTNLADVQSKLVGTELTYQLAEPLNYLSDCLY